ncbi:hypothetical protein K438DRAFT_1770908 [Mycena galopus ATCC 62051]|nr:hypothetical protein K438DRAFT_1770908 [Mycena galopus ATCC 62051]
MMEAVFLRLAVVQAVETEATLVILLESSATSRRSVNESQSPGIPEYIEFQSWDSRNNNEAIKTSAQRGWDQRSEWTEDKIRRSRDRQATEWHRRKMEDAHLLRAKSDSLR